MLWYIKEQQGVHNIIHGPYESKKEAEKIKLKAEKKNRLKLNVVYNIFESEDIL